jgi:CheY-like chemotaxis protein
VRLMGGDIRVDSRIGEGSVFSFDLLLPLLEPADVVTMPERQVVTGYAGPRLHVLIADDVPGNRSMLTDLLRPLGFDTHEAGNGAELIRLLAQQPADLVLMDMSMPVMDGLEAMRRIRGDASTSGTPIIAVSANASDIDKSQCLAAGANGFLPKPIDRQALLDEVALQLQLSWIVGAPSPSYGAVSHPPTLFVAPAMDELEALHGIALTGNMRAIRDRAAQLARTDPACAAFCEKLSALAAAYQSKAILSLVKEHLEKARAG